MSGPLQPVQTGSGGKGWAQRAWDDPLSLGLAGVFVLGAALRIRFALTTPQVFDEFNTVYAAQVILERGVPLLPSGYFYIHGLLFSYLEAPFVALAHLLPAASEFLWRLPGIISSLASAWLLFRVGQALLGRGVGLVAAALLLLLPEAIDWGTRARMYSLLQFLSLLTAWSFYRALHEQGSRYRWLFPLCFTAAMLTHLEAALLIPAFIVAAIVTRRGRWLLCRDGLISLSLCAVGATLPLLLERLGAAQLTGTTDNLLGVHGGLSQYLGSFDSADPMFIARYLAVSPRLCLAIPFAVVLGILLYSVWHGARHGWPGAPAWLPRRALGFLCTIYVFCLLEFILIVSWQSKDRYLHFLLPFIILPAAWVLWRAGRVIVGALASLAARKRGAQRQRRAWPLALLAVGGPLLMTLPLNSWSIPPVSAENPDYAAAFRWVRARWQAGDVILSPSVASMLYLGKLDYYLLESGYSGAVVEVLGRQLNSNSGAPRLQGAADLARVLDGEARTWVVFDEGRFPRNLSAETQALLNETMTLTWADRGMRVYENRRPYQEIIALLAEQADTTRDLIVASRPSGFETLYEGALPLYTLDPAWSHKETQSFLQTIAQDGRRVWYLRWKEPSASDQLAWRDYQWETHAFLRAQWAFGDADLFLYALEGDVTFDAAPDLVLTPGWVIGDALRLEQLTVPSVRTTWGQKVGIELDWVALARPDRHVVATVHVVDDQGRRWGQADVWLADEQGQPTVDWEAGQSVHQNMAIELCPGLSPGTYHLVYEARDRLTDERLLIYDAQGNASETAEIGLLQVTTAPYQPSIGEDISIPHLLNVAVAPEVTLLGTIDVPSSVTFGQDLAVGLIWRTTAAPQQDYALHLRLSGQDGAIIAEGRYALAGTGYETSRWQAGEIIWRYYTLHIDQEAGAGTATLALALSSANNEYIETPITLAEIEIDGHLFTTPTITHRQEALVGEHIRLLGYDLDRQALAPGQQVNLTLYWQALHPIEGSYKVFTHLLDADGAVRGQQDNLPKAGQYPTDAWHPGEIIVDRYQLATRDDAPSGNYYLEVGMYDPAHDNARIPLYAADGARQQDDRFLLDTPVVVE